jgi:hypothetical protein
MGIKNLINKLFKLLGRYNQLTILFFISLIEVCLFLLFFKIKFETSDDAAMNVIVAGSYTGSPSERLIFTNIWIGHVLKTLYNQFSNVNWYAWYLIFSFFIGYLGIQYKMQQLSNKWGTKLVIHIVVLLLLLPALSLLQFTKVASVLVLAGFLLILFNSRKSKYEYLCGGILLVIGSSIRFESLIMNLFFVAPLFILMIVKLKGKILLSVKCFIVVIGISFILSLVNNYSYSQDPEWKNYKEINSLRAKITAYDYPVFTYNNVKHVLNQKGWKIEDYNMASMFYFDMGIPKFSKENLLFIEENTSKLNNIKSIAFLSYSFVENINQFFSSYNKSGLLVLLLCTMVILLYRKDFNSIVVLLLFVSSIILLLWVLGIFTTGNFYKPRVVWSISLMIYVFILGLLFYNNNLEFKTFKGVELYIIVGMLLFLVFNQISTIIKINNSIKIVSKSKTIKEYIANKENQLYVTWVGVENMNVFDTPTNYKNAYFLGWFLETPFNKRKLNGYSGVKSNGLYSLCNKEVTWYFENIDNSLFPKRNQGAVINFYKSNFSEVEISKNILQINNKDTIYILKFLVQCK